MAEPTHEFFDRLAGQRQSLPSGLTGDVRFDIADGERTEHWYVHITRSGIDVSHQGPDPDCVVGTDIATFDGVVTGRMNAMAAILRGAIDISGKVILLAALQRLFPGSTGASETPAAGYARRPS